MDTAARRLYEIGRRDLETRFDPKLNLVRSPFLADKHMPHPSLWYALCLLADGDDTGAAEAIIERVLEMQETRETDPHHGNFRWFWQDGGVIDLNAGQFVLEALVHLLPRASHRLRLELQERIYEAMRLALAEGGRLDVHWTYTNIHLLDIQGRILAAQILGDTAIRASGEARLRDWAARTRAIGAPHEFNSPTYAAVQIQALATIAEHADDAATREIAIEMEHLIWRHIAQFWHVPTMQLGGPHSRAYRRDVVGAPGFLKVVLYKLLGDERLLDETPYYAGPAAEGQVMVALTQHHCPPDAERMFREHSTRTIRHRMAELPANEATATITPQFTLGTMFRPYGVGRPPEPWPAHDSCIAYFTQQEQPGYGVLYTRYRVNAAPVGREARPGPHWHDIWEDGIFRCAQAGGRAIVAYGLMPRGQRPVESLRLDIRLLAANPIVESNAQSAIAIAAGDVLIGIIPLEPTRLGHRSPVEVWRDGQELVISIINYEGPPKQFWEYRSLSGPFFKGNACNGFCVLIASGSDYESIEGFLDDLAANQPADEVTGSMRRIAWGEGEDALILEYDLSTMWP